MRCVVCQRTKGGCTFPYYNCTRGWDSNAIKPVTIAWPWTAVAHIVPFLFALLSLTDPPPPFPPCPLVFSPLLTPPAFRALSFLPRHPSTSLFRRSIGPGIINKVEFCDRVHRNRGKKPKTLLNILSLCRSASRKILLRSARIA